MKVPALIEPPMHDIEFYLGAFSMTGRVLRFLAVSQGIKS